MNGAASVLLLALFTSTQSIFIPNVAICYLPNRITLAKAAFGISASPTHTHLI